MGEREAAARFQMSFPRLDLRHAGALGQSAPWEALPPPSPACRRIPQREPRLETAVRFGAFWGVPFRGSSLLSIVDSASWANSVHAGSRPARSSSRSKAIVQPHPRSSVHDHIGKHRQ